MLEREYQKGLIKRLRSLFPGIVILKNDPNYIQGFPDLTLLFGNNWACLETKRQRDSVHQPNQDYYIRKLNNMSFAAFVQPENEEEVLNALQQAFGLRR